MEKINKIETDKIINALNRLDKFKANNDYIEEYHNYKTALLSLINYQRNEVENLIHKGLLDPNQGAMLIDSLNGLLEYARMFVNLISDKNLSDIAEIIGQINRILPKAPF
jgi:hypothetical protein|nr:MAG TPA: hypothetical protein [Caudoviricetes sp.]